MYGKEMQNHQPACQAFKQHITAATIHGGLYDQKLLTCYGPDGHCLRGEEQGNGRAESQGLCKATMGSLLVKNWYDLREHMLTSGRN